MAGDIPTEFEHKGVTYQIQRLDGMQQFMLARLLMPMIPAALRIFFQGDFGARTTDIMTMEPGPEKNAAIDALARDVSAFTDVFRDTPDEAMHKIVASCLGTLRRRVGDVGWQIVYNPDSNRPMYSDIDGWDVLIFCIQVVTDQIGNFLLGVLSAVTSGLRPSPTSL